MSHRGSVIKIEISLIRVETPSFHFSYSLIWVFRYCWKMNSNNIFNREIEKENRMSKIKDLYKVERWIFWTWGFKIKKYWNRANNLKNFISVKLRSLTLIFDYSLDHRFESFPELAVFDFFNLSKFFLRYHVPAFASVKI